MTDHKEFAEDINQLVQYVAQLEASKDAVNERAKELAEKYEEHPSYSLKAAQIKKIASIIYKDNADEEKSKAMEIFDIVESLED